MSITNTFQAGSFGDTVTLIVSVQGGTASLDPTSTYAIEFSDPTGLVVKVPAVFTVPNLITVSTAPAPAFNFYIPGIWRAQGFIYPVGSTAPGKTSVAQIQVLQSLS